MQITTNKQEKNYQGQEKNYLHLNIHVKHSKVKKERAKVKLLPVIEEEIFKKRKIHVKPRAKP